MSHYFTDNTNLKSEETSYKTTILNQELTFITDNGVFSKSRLDFGSRLLIESFINPKIEGKLLDLGCGIGVIGISLAKAYNREIFMSDVNPRAVSLAEKNALNNKISFNICVSDAFQNITESFAIIITNPPIRAGKTKIYEMFEESYKHLILGGELWFVMRRNQGAESAIKKIDELFFNHEIVEKDNGFWIIKAIKNN